jgi:general secretion pathway protein G
MIKMGFKNSYARGGFTLMELLVTIAIIGILSAISLFALVGARVSARDARRKSDMESIRSALELYRSDCNQYPSTFPSVGQPLVSTNPPCPTANIRYLEKIPGDPLVSTSYRYTRLSNTRYVLCARLEEAPVPAFSAADLALCGGSCPNVAGGSTCNYVVFSP